MLTKPAFLLAFTLALVLPVRSPAAIIGSNPPSHALTMERIATLKDRRQRIEWEDYLRRSQQQLKADQRFLQKEMKEHGLQESVVAPGGRTRGLALDKPASWYGETEAVRIADIVVSFQTPAGGWSKNLDMTKHVRAPGEHFAADNVSRFLGNGDNDTPHEGNWNYVGTFDNDATTMQMRFLAKVASAVGEPKRSAYQKAFLRGLDYIFVSQYPNGGWPQVWPLQGGYHDSITYNDGAMAHIIELLQEVGEGKDEFGFVPARLRTRAAAVVKRGIECFLVTQIKVEGRRTVWGQQYDMLTLEPTSARNYEMPSAASGESAEITLFLMRLPNASSEIEAAVHGAVNWFEKTQVRDVAFRVAGTEGRKLVPAPGNGPIWSRYYEIGSDRPIFGDRDKSIHDDVNEISAERRRGYAWYGNGPARVLQQYERWRKKEPKQVL